MDRRSFFLALAGGLAATAVSGIVASEAEAMPVSAASPVAAKTNAEAVAEAVMGEQPEEMQYYYYRRPRRYYYRPRPIYRPRRRCWYNRWGRMVCAY